MTRFRRWFRGTRLYGTICLWRGDTVVYRARILNGTLVVYGGAWIVGNSWVRDEDSPLRADAV